MKKLLILSTSIVLLLVSGCTTTTNISSYRDPDFHNVGFKKILVVVAIQELGVRQLAENDLKEAFKKRGIDVFTGLELLPPTRSLSNEAISEILKSNNIDGLLVLAMEGFWESQSYVSPSSSTEGYGYLVGNSINYTKGAYFVSQTEEKFVTRLFDIKTGKIAWMASAKTSTGSYTPNEIIISSITEDLAQYLVDEKLVIK